MFIPLRNHTHYTLLKALTKVPELVSRATTFGLTSLAISDAANMYGTIEFYKECQKKKIKPLITVAFNIKVGERFYDLLLIAKTYTGYKNLMRITSEAQLRDIKHPHMLFSDLENFGTDIICLSGGPWGEISDTLKVYDEHHKSKALEIYNKYKNVCEFYLEITNHKHMDYGEEMRSNTISFAKENNLDLVATQHSYYLKPDDKPAHKTLVNVHSDDTSTEFYNSFFKAADFHFLSQDEAKENFKDIPEAVEMTQKISDSVNFEIPLGAWVFPAIEYKKSYDEDLRDLAYAGLITREKELTEEVKTRIEYELQVIKNKGYSPYFLVVHDLLRYSHENGILTNIRGSVAGSLITYLLHITKCDPLEYKLPFERFLNPERPSAPDIDMDFADDRRDEVIDYARTKYGKDHVGQIGTFGTMMARGAVRDVARAMKYPYMVGDKISRMIPPPKQGFPMYIDKALEEVPELKEMYDNERETYEILEMAKKVEGCVRHISVHAAGTVISPTPIYEFSPIQWDPKEGDKIITQYDMYTIEDAGLLKFDFLGIRNLSILATAIKIVKERYDIVLDIETIDLGDKKTFEMLARGETLGLFQLNGSGMTRFLKELKPTTVHDINAMVALYRPGPLEMIPEYIRRKHNAKLIEFLDPRLEPILDMSYGVIVYQDDVMLTAIHLAGYSWLDADKLRKAMGKKIPAEMTEQKEKLMKGFQTHGLSKNKADELWTRIEPFAAYGFNKAHAASYGRVAYQTAFMKANYPVAYTTAILTNESGDVEKISEIVGECKRMGIAVLPPDVNYSGGGFEIISNPETGKEEIRFGLYTIKNLGKDIADAIIAEREKNGKFKTFEEFLERILHKNLTKKSIEALSMCGALDDLVERNLVINNIEDILQYHKDVIKDNSMQDSLFAASEPTKFTFKNKTPATAEQKLIWEKNLLGLYVSGFPLDPWKKRIEEIGMNIKKVQDDVADNIEVSIGVIIETIKITKTKKGDKMALLGVRDYTGAFEVAIFPKTYAIIKDKIIKDIPIVIRGKVSSRNGDKTMMVDEIKELTK